MANIWETPKNIYSGTSYTLNINYSLYRMTQPDTWLHILLCCKKPHIHKLRINRHNKAIHEIHKLLISNTKSCCFILVNVGKSNGQAQENTVPN
jgi:hypothetical protein